MTSPEGVGIRMILSSSLASRLTSLYGLLTGMHSPHAGHGFQDAQVDSALIAGNADGGANGARDGMRLQAEAFDAFAHSADLLLGGVRTA